MPSVEMLMKLAPYVVVPIIEKIFFDKGNGCDSPYHMPYGQIPSPVRTTSDEELMAIIRRIPGYENKCDDELRMLVKMMRSGMKF